MKKYFKKFSIMFVMLLSLVGAGVIQNGTVANAEVGQQLSNAETGWKRYDDSDSKILYIGKWSLDTEKGLSNFTNKAAMITLDNNASINFSFKGTKFRYLGYSDSRDNIRSINDEVYVDGKKQENVLNFNIGNGYSLPTVLYEVQGLNNSIHNIQIKMVGANSVTTKYANIDAIDIDDTGYLMEPAISLDNKILTVPVDSTQQLTATTTPAGAQVDWSSDNAGIVTVQLDGTVKGISEGTATITAKIKGTDIKATCVVTVTKGGTNEPTNPNPPAGDENLFIELVDGQIKSYQVTASQIEDFKQWYLDRDNTKSNKPYYHFAKGSYNDYVIHDKIDWFEVR